jgi:hypothetical protein
VEPGAAALKGWSGNRGSDPMARPATRQAAGGASAAAAGDAQRPFDRAFALASFAMNRFVVDHMLRAGRLATENDYEALLILGVLAHQNVAHLLPPGCLPAQVLDEGGLPPGLPDALRPLRLRDLTQITRLPRETVRRKLTKLAASGLVERRGAEWLADARAADARLRGLTRESLQRFLAAADVVRHALDEAEADAPVADPAPPKMGRGTFR